MFVSLEKSRNVVSTTFVPIWVAVNKAKQARAVAEKQNSGQSPAQTHSRCECKFSRGYYPEIASTQQGRISKAGKDYRDSHVQTVGNADVGANNVSATAEVIFLHQTRKRE